MTAVDEFLLDSDVEEVVSELADVADDFSGKTILLAGGRGFLGRYLTAVFAELNRSRLREPCRLIVIDNLITAGRAGKEQRESPNTRFIEHDVTKPLEVDEHVDCVVHAAGIPSPTYYQAYPLETLDVAIAGNRNLLDLALGHGARYTFFSSSEIYGDPDPKHLPTPETYRGNVSTQSGRACYDEGKRVGETLCHVYHTYFGLHTNIIRPFNVYGPGMQESDYRVLPNFASSIKARRPLWVYGTGFQTRTFCYVTDALNGFIRVIARGLPGEAYNIGTPEPEVNMRELARRIEEVVGRRIDIRVTDYPDSYPGDEPNRRCPDITKAQVHLAYRPRIDLDLGLRRFLSWSDRVYTGAEQTDVGTAPSKSTLRAVPAARTGGTDERRAAQ
jgi:UDP-glucuronate decarboxylase